MKYLTNCTESTAELIDEMTEQGIEISYEELLQNVSQQELNEVFPAYVGIEDILTLESDYAVSYYKSIYFGEPCVYVEHSLIEYIFTNH